MTNITKETTYDNCQEALEAFFDNKFRTSLYNGMSVFTVEAPGGGKIDLSMPHDDILVMEYRQGTTVPANAETGIKFHYKATGGWNAVIRKVEAADEKKTILEVGCEGESATSWLFTKRELANGDVFINMEMSHQGSASDRRINTESSGRVSFPENN